MTESQTSAPPTHAPVAARVVALRTFPVKSLDGEQLSQVRVLASGLEHDRAWAVVDADGQVVTGRRAPALRDVRAAVAQSPADGPALVPPGRENAPVHGTAADEVLTRVVGAPVRVQAAPGGGTGFTEVAAVHLVSRQAVAAAAAPADGADGGDGTDGTDGAACDVEDPRANVVLDLADGEDLETTWVGREVHLGEAVLRVTQTPKHCLGVYAEVVRPGRVAVDDEVRVLAD
jgi:MOSC domain-containing protein